MANTFESQKQQRDHYLLSALYLTPLTIPQLLELSRTWPAPFYSWDTLYHRLEKLRGGGWVRRWPYAIAIHGAEPPHRQEHRPRGDHGHLEDLATRELAQLHVPQASQLAPRLSSNPSGRTHGSRPIRSAHPLLSGAILVPV